MKLGVITTWKCNLKCKHCIYECPKNEELKFLDYERIFTKLLKHNLEQISFSGGEAILNPEFEKMVELTYNNNIFFKITSNALKYEKYLPIIQKYRSKFIAFHFSIDGLKEVHDYIRVKGSFDKVVEAIFYYHLLNVKIVVNLVLNRYNFSDFEKLIKFCAGLKIYGIKVGAIVPTRTNKEFQVTFEQRKEIYSNLKNWSEKYKIKLVNTNSLFIVDETKFCPVLYSDDLNLNQRGELTFCCNIPGSFGKLRYNSEDMSLILKKKYELGEKIKIDRAKEIKTLLKDNKTCDFCNEYFKVIK